MGERNPRIQPANTSRVIGSLEVFLDFRKEDAKAQSSHFGLPSPEHSSHEAKGSTPSLMASWRHLIHGNINLRMPRLELMFRREWSN